MSGKLRTALSAGELAMLSHLLEIAERRTAVNSFSFSEVNLIFGLLQTDCLQLNITNAGRRALASSSASQPIRAETNGEVECHG